MNKKNTYYNYKQRTVQVSGGNGREVLGWGVFQPLAHGSGHNCHVHVLLGAQAQVDLAVECRNSSQSQWLKNTIIIFCNHIH